MRTLIILAILVLCTPAYAGSVDMRTGSLSLPQGYTHQAFNGTDSTPGTIKRTGDAFVITYDIGAMAGTVMHPGRLAECEWFIEHEVDGHRAYTGIVSDQGKRTIATTILDPDSNPRLLPANFRAEVHSERDIAEFVLIATSYRSKTRP